MSGYNYTLKGAWLESREPFLFSQTSDGIKVGNDTRYRVIVITEY